MQLHFVAEFPVINSNSPDIVSPGPADTVIAGFFYSTGPHTGHNPTRPSGSTCAGVRGQESHRGKRPEAPANRGGGRHGRRRRLGTTLTNYGGNRARQTGKNDKFTSSLHKKARRERLEEGKPPQEANQPVHV